MKMERLIGILSILLQREKVTAPELAETFEVSCRTIQRDADALCRAGIRSLDSVSGTRHYAQLVEKLSAGTGGMVSGSASPEAFLTHTV